VAIHQSRRTNGRSDPGQVDRACYLPLIAAPFLAVVPATQRDVETAGGFLRVSSISKVGHRRVVTPRAALSQRQTPRAFGI
jgi:hypothetical protein